MIFPPFLALVTWIGLHVCGRMRSSWAAPCRAGRKGGLWVGLSCLIVGYLGPILLSSGSNQGPVLGIFVLGPLGYVIGAFSALLIATRRDRLLRP